jgi:chemotaxis signal transduction protein
MSRMNAWILDFGMGCKAAVGGRELLHLIDMPTTFSVPCTPLYCRRVVFWQERLLAVMDIASRLNGTAQQAKYIAVVAYQQRRGDSPLFGALLLATPPLQAAVSDEQACRLPENTLGWDNLAISCFDYLGDAMPVLNLNRLFETPQSSDNRHE